jgi:long-chain acyl-CoA synthetase
LPRLLEFAVYHAFMHLSDRTVHEQILFRLDGRSRPVKYHDIVEGKVVTRTAAEVRREILKAAASMQALGVAKGDRIAIVGLNSTRYLALDVAIGLAGAVSVPIYYTSPPAEMDAIIKESGARLFFVGAPGILGRSGELRSGPHVISFCRGPVGGGPGRKVTSWEDFLALGKGRELPAEAPVGFGDIATLRYTSGTTGKPKGVIFRHDNLRFMAGTVVSLMPWKAQRSAVSYLSFLPLNHVVEGILSTYSPYYAPAPLNIYYLEDFRDLQRALPMARPTIFFSVPRVYEKLWEGLLATGPGTNFARSAPGLKKRLLAGLLRGPLLRRAGLDRCAQLIVGSAPVGEGLLSNLRELGVEVHDAYGLTEAPLVTLNRLGANRIGTVGQPLPETEIKIAQDGEILVRGPQVTRGYFGETEQPFSDGWLLTGDLGRLDGGFLVIDGRKKELLATSYGKKIQPGKIEGMLKALGGVAEAMVVGEDRPYCTAMLWVGEDWMPGNAAMLDRAILEMNTQAANPEQLRRWAVMANDLRIENGELTANLKLRRSEVLRMREAVVKALYGEGEAPPAVLHMGADGRRK